MGRDIREISRMRCVSRNRRCGSARYVADVSISTGKYRLPPGLAVWRESYPIVAHRFPRSQGRAGRGNPRLCSQTLLSLVCHDRFIRSVPRCTRIQGKGRKKGQRERERERFVDCRRTRSCLCAILIRWVAWSAMGFRCERMRQRLVGLQRLRTHGDACLDDKMTECLGRVE